jgi:malate synthase
MAQVTLQGVRVTAEAGPSGGRVLTPEALSFVAALHHEFEDRRRALLARRTERRAALAAGALPDFLPETSQIREGEWRVAEAPPDLVDRRVEITGPVERKMMINALNSGARVFMADFEDALSPTWSNVVEGQANLMDAVRRTLEYDHPDGRRYRLNDEVATLVVRPRGWHLVEKHVEIGGAPVAAGLFDFGLHFYHNARELLDRGSGPYYYLPKLESHHEARLWNDVFRFAQESLGIPVGSIRATVLIETILAAFEMEEILWELREHAAGLNAGRWDYIFSVIKMFGDREEFVLPDRAQVTMEVPFMRAYTELLVRTCHRRGAHAIGGMAAFIPSRRDPKVNEVALAKVREDKVRESRDGFDGTWVAHPDLVPVAREVFDEVLGDAPHQKHRTRDDVRVTAADLLALRVPGGTVTREGVENDVRVAIEYLGHWLAGQGAVGILNLMEDAATAEIARAQLWQWIRHRAGLAEGGEVTAELYAETRDRALQRLGQAQETGSARFREAAALLDELVLGEEFVEFLTLPAYRHLP